MIKIKKNNLIDKVFLFTILFLTNCLIEISDKDYDKEIFYFHRYEGQKLIFLYKHPEGKPSIKIYKITVHAEKEIVWSLDWRPPIELKEIEYGENHGASLVHVRSKGLRSGDLYLIKIYRPENLGPDCYRFIYDPKNQFGKKEIGENCKSLTYVFHKNNVC